MGLFDIFSSSSGRQAADRGYKAQKKGINAAGDLLRTGREDATNALNQAEQEAYGYLDDSYNTARGDIFGGTTDALGQLQSGVTAGQNYFGQGMDYLTGGDAGYAPLQAGADQAAGYYQAGMVPFQGLYDRGTGGIDAYTALLNNPDSVFDSELYKTRENAGVEGINRLANSRGMLASGNNTQDILDYMRRGGLDYFNTLMNLHQPYFGLAQSGAAGIQAGNNQLGGLYDRLGQNQSAFLQEQARRKAELAGQQADLAYRGGLAGSALYGNQASNLANLATGYGTNRANIATGTGENLANVHTGTYNNLANLQTALGQAGYQNSADRYAAEQTANQNRWGALLGLGTAAIGAI